MLIDTIKNLPSEDAKRLFYQNLRLMGMKNAHHYADFIASMPLDFIKDFIKSTYFSHLKIGDWVRENTNYYHAKQIKDIDSDGNILLYGNENFENGPLYLNPYCRFQKLILNVCEKQDFSQGWVVHKDNVHEMMYIAAVHDEETVVCYDAGQVPIADLIKFNVQEAKNEFC